jgi:hypothetical protein
MNAHRSRHRFLGLVSAGATGGMLLSSVASGAQEAKKEYDKLPEFTGTSKKDALQEALDAAIQAPWTAPSPRRTQLEPGFIERGTLRRKRLHRAAVVEVIPWSGSSEPETDVPATPNEPSDPLKLARYYQSLLDSGQFENRAALARYLGVSRARVTQVLKRLKMSTSNEFV